MVIMVPLVFALLVIVGVVRVWSRSSQRARLSGRRPRPYPGRGGDAGDVFAPAWPDDGNGGHVQHGHVDHHGHGAGHHDAGDCGDGGGGDGGGGGGDCGGGGGDGGGGGGD